LGRSGTAANGLGPASRDDLESREGVCKNGADVTASAKSTMRKIGQIVRLCNIFESVVKHPVISAR
jgi:hypothetical protein